MAEIYQPSDDSYFFVEFLEKYLSDLEGDVEYLDMGTGSGILAETASKIIGKENVIAVDINPKAIDSIRKKNLNAIKSDLFSNINGSFDIITFNAPYLPKDFREPESSALSTTGGERGDEVSLEFLKQAKDHLNPEGKIFLLVSSLTPMDKINVFNPKIVAKKKIHLEELIILEFS